MSDPLCPKGKELGCQYCIVYRALKAYVRGFISYGELVRRIKASLIPDEWKELLIRNPDPNLFKFLCEGGRYTLIQIRDVSIPVSLPCCIVVDSLREAENLAKKLGAVVETRVTKDVAEKALVKVVTAGRMIVKLADRRVEQNATIILTSPSIEQKVVYALALASGVQVRTVGFMFGTVTETDLMFMGRLLDIADINFVTAQVDAEQLLNKMPNIMATLEHFKKKGGDYETVVKILGLDRKVFAFDMDLEQWYNPYHVPRHAAKIYRYIDPAEVLHRATGLDRRICERIVSEFGCLPRPPTPIVYLFEDYFPKVVRIVNLLRMRYPDLERELDREDSPVTKALKLMNMYDVVKAIVKSTEVKVEYGFDKLDYSSIMFARDVEHILTEQTEPDLLKYIAKRLVETPIDPYAEKLEEGIYDAAPDEFGAFIIVTKWYIIWCKVHKDKVTHIYVRCLVCGYEAKDGVYCSHVPNVTYITKFRLDELKSTAAHYGKRVELIDSIDKLAELAQKFLPLSYERKHVLY